MTKADSSAVPDFLAMTSMAGKGAVVLGAGQGIGRQVSHALAQAGATVLCVDREADLAKEVAQEVSGIACSADVTTREGMQSVFDLARLKLKNPQAIVDIVGRAYIGPIEELDDDAYQAQHNMVYRHAWLAIQLGAPWLAENGGGSIVLIGSVSGIASFQGQALHGSNKAALHHLGRCAAVEYGPRAVRINSVAAGSTRTPRLNQMIGDGGWDEVAASVPLRRPADPADIASVVLFLCSAMSRHVTAQTLVVDGGVTATTMRSGVQVRPKASD
ncbi:hypothetical protein AU184_08795 [Mycolicibacterium novocastrense]|uniref:SDR family NAD(P)-dependent oxidoreductase n=1 Tax=Mycolicibacterium novocastrense TaxID=59813 RepID=UPI00074B086D|nr:SDR family oxidoreductase [Mycolicibacterium novocastrense]KUH69813.1 hypothetical protein AU184_08795 [Mycolicibacterium novocastrense]KUH71362.1 hypothetical protein AU183_06165 [Mycolicibacterium novocastrense]KUH74426.1 hypothetical protein AU072_17580 [Mycolicibacterium novocastrense]